MPDLPRRQGEIPAKLLSLCREFSGPMTLTRAGMVFAAVVVALFAVTGAVVLTAPYEDPFGVIVRLTGLWGFLALSIATMLTPFLRDILRVFGSPFLAMHHTFAAVGLLLPVLHPVALALRAMNLTMFIPVFYPWARFWALAGRPALYLLIIAFAGVLLRRYIPEYWRWVHGLMYVVLLFAIVHGNLIGTDFQNPIIWVLFNTLFALTAATFVLRRWQMIQKKRKAVQR
jgi:predicted ferric reductase